MRSFSCARSSPADPIAATASRSPGSPACRVRSSIEHARFSARWSAPSWHAGGGPPAGRTTTDPHRQLGLFQAGEARGDALREKISTIDVDRMTPLEALALLAELKREL